MQTVKIKVMDKKDKFEKHIETRFVEVESDRRLTGAMAVRVIRREFPEIGAVSSALKTEIGWTVQRALKPTEKCDFHFVWRHYTLTPA